MEEYPIDSPPGVISIHNKFHPMRWVSIAIAALIVSALLFFEGCVTAPIQSTKEYREHPASIFYTESDFTFAFDEPETWLIFLEIEDERIPGIDGKATGIMYFDQSEKGVFDFVTIVKANGKIERIGLAVLGMTPFNFDRYRDTDKFYPWTLEEYLKAYPDERIEEETIDEPVDKSHGI